MTSVDRLKIMAAGTAIASLLAISQQSATAQEAVGPPAPPIVFAPEPAPETADTQEQPVSSPALEDMSPDAALAPVAQAAPKAVRHYRSVRRNRHYARRTPASAAHSASPAEIEQQASSLSSGSDAASPAYTVVNTMASAIPLAQDFEKKRATTATSALDADKSLFLGIGTGAALLLSGGIFYGFHRRRKSLAERDTEDFLSGHFAQNQYEAIPDQPLEMTDSPALAEPPPAPVNSYSSGRYHLGHVTVAPPSPSPASQTAEMQAAKLPPRQSKPYGTIRFSYSLRPRTS